MNIIRVRQAMCKKAAFNIGPNTEGFALDPRELMQTDPDIQDMRIDRLLRDHIDSLPSGSQKDSLEWQYQKWKNKMPNGVGHIASGLPHGGYETFEKKWYEKYGIPGLVLAPASMVAVKGAGVAGGPWGIALAGATGLGSLLSSGIRRGASNKLQNAQIKADNNAIMMQMEANRWRREHGKPEVEYRNIYEQRADPENKLPSSVYPGYHYEPGKGYVRHDGPRGTGSQKHFTHQTMINQ